MADGVRLAVAPEGVRESETDWLAEMLAEAVEDSVGEALGVG